MKLQDIDFGVGFSNQIRMGVKSKKRHNKAHKQIKGNTLAF